MTVDTIFEAFREEADTSCACSLTGKVNRFIEDNEKKGYSVSHQTVHMGSGGENSLIKPPVVITVWMTRPRALQGV